LISQSPTTPVRTDAAPTGARLLPGGIAELAEARRRELVDRLAVEAQRTAAESFDKAVEELESFREGLLDSVAEVTIELALEVARSLLVREITAGDYDITAIVRTMLASEGGKVGATVIHVHPDDAQALEAVRFRSGTDVQADPALRRGDVRIETEQGLLVRELDDCLLSIRENLREVFES